MSRRGRILSAVAAIAVVLSGVLIPRAFSASRPPPTRLTPGSISIKGSGGSILIDVYNPTPKNIRATILIDGATGLTPGNSVGPATVTPHETLGFMLVCPGVGACQGAPLITTTSPLAAVTIRFTDNDGTTDKVYAGDLRKA